MLFLSHKRRLLIKKLHYLVLSLICTLNLFSQTEEQVAVLISDLQKIYFEVESDYRVDKDTSSSTELLTSLGNFKIIDTNNYGYISYLDTFYKAKEDLLRKQIGLSATAGFVQNIDPTFADVDENLIYQRRYQAGLDWQILKGGFIDNRNQIKSIPAERSYFNYLEHFQKANAVFGPKMNQCLYWFNKKKIEILEERSELLNTQIILAEKLYFLKKIDKQDVLILQTRLAEVEGMKGIYAAYNEELDQGFNNETYELEAPLFDLNYEVLFGALENQFVMDSISIELEKAIMDQQNWYTEIGLRAYTRYNIYDLVSTNPSYRAFFSLGLTATAPIPFAMKEKRKMEQVRIQRKSENLQKQSTDKRLEILNEAYEYRYKLKQYVGFHQKKILALESLRRERVKEKLLDADFNPLNALHIIDNIMQLDIELLDLKQNLYLKVLRIQNKQMETPLESMVVPMDLPNFFDFEDRTNRGVYVWSKTFRGEISEFLAEYALYNKFDQVYLAAASKDTLKATKQKFIAELQKRGVKHEWMIGDNRLLEKEDIVETIFKRLAYYDDTTYTGLHIDIEPHTRDDYQENKAELLQQYVNQIERLSIACKEKGIALAIDVPLHYPQEYLDQLFELVDNVHFMCYENIKPTYVARKTELYRTQYPEKVHIAVRTEDFENRLEMEKYVRNFSKDYGVYSFDFHDLRRMIEQDTKVLNTDEKY